MSERLRPRAIWVPILWFAILASALALGALFQWLQLPAPWMLGPMVAGIAFGCSPIVTPRVSRRIFIPAQAIVGIALAAAIRPTFLSVVVTHWWLMILVVAGTVVMAMAVASVLARTNTLDAETATLGAIPGGAAAMTALAVEYGADVRVVAFMQYIRITVVVASASLVAHVIFGVTPHLPPAVATPASLSTIAITVLLAAAGATIGHFTKLPSGYFLGPIFLGAGLEISGLFRVGLPVWLLDASYITIGLFVGLIFTMHSVIAILRVLPQLLMATLALMAGCAAMSVALVQVARIDPLSAYLSTTPGGIDSVTIIALSGGADVATIVALQTARIFIVMPFGPRIARVVASRTRLART